MESHTLGTTPYYPPKKHQGGKKYTLRPKRFLGGRLFSLYTVNLNASGNRFSGLLTSQALFQFCFAHATEKYNRKGQETRVQKCFSHLQRRAGQGREAEGLIVARMSFKRNKKDGHHKPRAANAKTLTRRALSFKTTTRRSQEIRCL